MKPVLSALALVVLFASCQKDLSSKQDAAAASTVSSDVLLPLPFHSVSFTTDYPANSAQLFTFTKTLYPDTRVSRLIMTSRRNINSPYFEPQGAFNYDYQFVYSTNKATITRRYKTSDEPDFSQPYSQPFKYECILNNDGYCTEIRRIGTPASDYPVRIGLTYSGKRLTQIWVPFVDDQDEYTTSMGHWDVAYDANGNVTAITPQGDVYPQSSVYYTYNLNKKGNYCYMPTQYLFSQWFSLLEVMQWIPMEVNERKSVSLKVNFVDWSAGTDHAVNRTILQGQSYYNHKYDANGNLISYTYGDNVAQKITWK